MPQPPSRSRTTSTGLRLPMRSETRPLTNRATSAHSHGTAVSSPTWKSLTPPMSSTIDGSQKVTAYRATLMAK